MDGLSVDLRELLEYIVYAELMDPLRRHLVEFPSKIETIIAHVKDAARFLSFNLSSSEFSEESFAESDRQSIINQTLGRIEKEKESVTVLQQELMDAIDQGLKQLTEKINPYLIIQSSNELRRYIRYQESKKVISIFGKKSRNLEIWANQVLVKIIYKQNQEVLKTREWETDSHGAPRVKEILAWVDTVSPGIPVLKGLPFHYKQLFLSDQPPSKDFWVGRQKELARAKIAIERFRTGTSGALMITGERSSGKSSLSHFIAYQFFDRQSVFQIFPPGSGSCSVEVFHQCMESAFQLRGSTEHLFLQIPSQSVIVVHNLELWWERYPQGNAIMNHIEWMIRQFGHQCFFILNMNTHTLKLLRNLQKIEEYFLDVIECPPMTAEQLKTIILLRHKTTGMKFKLEGQPEEGLSEVQLARQFIRFFDYTRGNVGMALHTWISHIESITGDTLEIAAPSLPDLSAASELPMEWMVVILQFVLHKILDQSKLMRLMGWKEPQYKRFIDVLHRSGIIQSHDDGLWSINPYLEPFLTDQLRARKML